MEQSDAASRADDLRPRRIRQYLLRYWPSFGAGIVFLILTQSFALTVPRLLREATDALAATDYGRAKRMAQYLLGVAVLGAVVRIFSRVLIFNSGRRVEADVRSELFAKLAKMPPSFFAKMSSGQVMSRAVNDLTQVRLLLGPGILNLTNTGLAYMVVVPILFLRDPVLAAATLASLPLLMLAGRIFGKRMYDDSREAQERLGALSTKVQENLGGVMTVRVYRREEAELARFEELNERFVQVNLRLARLRGFMFPVMGLFGAFGTVMLLWLGGHKMMRGELTVGQFVEFNGYLAALTWPTIALGWMISLWQRGMASMDRINEVFTATPTIADGPSAPPAKLEGGLELRELTFAYAEGAAPALDHVSARFSPGETVVIVGRTGSGKTTLLRAIARLIEVPKGTVFLDGADVVDLPLGAVRSTLAYAPQDAFLFSRTIGENVAFGKPGATKEEVAAAVRRAALSSDVAGFPDGLDTIVGERGITLSGGQRQRTALARALLADAKVLLLDDTLAAVDTDTEAKILGALRENSAGRTTLLVTHRLACAAQADRILVMDGGRIVEQGTEEELLALGGVYAEMHKRQRLREAIEHETQAAAREDAAA